MVGVACSVWGSAGKSESKDFNPRRMRQGWDFCDDKGPTNMELLLNPVETCSESLAKPWK